MITVSGGSEGLSEGLRDGPGREKCLFPLPAYLTVVPNTLRHRANSCCHLRTFL